MTNLQIEEIEDVNIHDETFRILNLDTLNWAFRKLSTIQSKENEIKSLAKAEQDRIKKWEDEQLININDSKAFFNRLVEDYHFRTLLENPKAKTLSTPYGKSKSRASKAQPEQSDKDLVLKHILANDMRDFIKEDVKWGDFKKSLKISEVDGVASVFDENGEIVPGVVVKPDSVSFSTEVT